MEEKFNLISFVKVETAGIIWVTEKPLSYDSKGVYEVNYLLNGLLIQTLASGLSHPQHNLYLSENFGEPFFVIHHSAKNLEELYNNLSLVQTSVNEGKEILFLTDNHSDHTLKIHSGLSKKCPDQISDPIYLN